MHRSWSHVACAAACGCLLAGCRFALVSDQGWGGPQTAPPSDRAATALHRPAPKTVPLEIVFARADEGDAAWQDDLWKLADEQAFDDAVRRRLAANGLRVGLLGGSPPPELAARLEPAVPAQADDLPAAPEERPAVVRRFLKLLPGRDNEVVAATGLTELVMFEHDGTEVHGGTYRDATASFALKVWPAADGRVRIELLPTLKHGPLERSWVGEEGVFRLETGQRRHSLGRLALTTTIPHGGMLLVGPTGDATSTVGDAFFHERSASRRSRRMLVIKLRDRLVDPLFAAASAPASEPSPSGAN